MENTVSRDTFDFVAELIITGLALVPLALFMFLSL